LIERNTEVRMPGGLGGRSSHAQTASDYERVDRMMATACCFMCSSRTPRACGRRWRASPRFTPGAALRDIARSSRSGKPVKGAGIARPFTLAFAGAPLPQPAPARSIAAPRTSPGRKRDPTLLGTDAQSAIRSRGSPAWSACPAGARRGPGLTGTLGEVFRYVPIHCRRRLCWADSGDLSPAARRPFAPEAPTGAKLARTGVNLVSWPSRSAGGRRGTTSTRHHGRAGSAQQRLGCIPRSQSQVTLERPTRLVISAPPTTQARRPASPPVVGEAICVDKLLGSLSLRPGAADQTEEVNRAAFGLENRPGARREMGISPRACREPPRRRARATELAGGAPAASAVSRSGDGLGVMRHSAVSKSCLL
jgi:hypothetical protein